MKPEISVIVPVYNIENYLWPCLETLKKQTFSNIEILLVDDGSVDGSGRICEKAAREDNRFRVIHQDNRGLSKAREAGVRQARGDWIMFVDGDDWVSEDFCQRALEGARKNDADICIFEFFEVWQTRPFSPVHQAMTRSGLLNRDQAMTLLAGSQILDYLWNKIYRRSLLAAMVFPDCRLLEDMRTCCRIFNRASRFYLLPDRLYYYRRRKGSLTSNMSGPGKSKEVLQASYDKYRYISRACPGAEEAMDQLLLSRELTYYAFNYFVPGERRSLDMVRQRILGRQKLPAATTGLRKRALGLLRRSGLAFALSWRIWTRIKERKQAPLVEIEFYPGRK